MHGITDKLEDLSWLGPHYSDMGWFETDIASPPEPLEMSEGDKVERLAKARLKESDWTMLLDAPLTNLQRADWKMYRARLRSISGQKGFPEKIKWPIPPN